MLRKGALANAQNSVAHGTHSENNVLIKGAVGNAKIVSDSHF